jgi:hypothetical protein
MDDEADNFLNARHICISSVLPSRAHPPRSVPNVIYRG